MLSKEAELENESAAEREFIVKISDLIVDYRTQVNSGHIIGVLETVKLRFFLEVNHKVEKEAKE